MHLERLVTLEYLLVHRGMRGHSFVYELLFDGPAASESPHLSGLIDRGYDDKFAGVGPPVRGVNAGGSRGQRGYFAVR